MRVLLQTNNDILEANDYDDEDDDDSDDNIYLLW